jgi:glutathione S-transferase
MKLFYASDSSSLLPHIVLLEAGLPFTAIKIDEHTKVIEGGGDYRKVNPLGYVPALVLDDDTLLTEGPCHRAIHCRSGSGQEIGATKRHDRTH